MFLPGGDVPGQTLAALLQVVPQSVRALVRPRPGNLGGGLETVTGEVGDSLQAGLNIMFGLFEMC